MASRLALRWSSSGVLLVVLALGRPGSAQEVLPFEPEVGLERIGDLESTAAVAFEGVVQHPSGAPAEGAVVVSSAGGQAVTDPSGSFRLEARVPLEAESVQITAVGRAGRNLLASTRVPLLAPSGSMQVGPLVLAQGGTCSPAWLPTFGGQPGTNTTVNALTVFDDGGGPALYAAGDFTTAGGVAAHHIAKWDGSGWTSLGSGAANGMTNSIHALAVFDDGGGPALYAGGDFVTAGGGAASRIAKWDGSSWTALGSGLNHSVFALTVFDDGLGPALYVGGSFTSAGGVTANRTAKWDGASWSALGGGMNDAVQALAVFDDGGGPALYAGGDFTTADGLTVNRIARWDGSSWSPLGSGISGNTSSVFALAVFDDGLGPALYVGGTFTDAGGVAANHVASWDGSGWAALGSGVGGDFASVFVLTAYDDGLGQALYAGGTFTSAGGAAAGRIAKWDGSSWAALGSGVGQGFPEVRALTVLEGGGGPTLYAGGFFTTAGGAAASYIAEWHGSSWATLGNGINSTIFALAAFDDGLGPALYAGGAFTSAGGVAANRIAKWDGSSWAPLGSGVNSDIRALTVFDDGDGPALYAGGNFTGAGGAPASRIAKWDGASWAALGSGMNATVAALAGFDDGGGPALYAAGSFNSAGGVMASRIAKWDGSSWAALGSGLNASVMALSVFDDGSGPALCAGGQFTSAGGVAVNRIAKWDGSGWAALGSGFLGGAIPTVYSLTVFDDGGGPALYAGGSFSTAGGAAANNIAKWDGSGWSALGSGINSIAWTLVAFDDGGGPALYAGGFFTIAGGVAASRIARWDGSNWAALGSGMNGDVLGLTAFDDGSGLTALYAGGVFGSAIDSSDSFLAKWGCPITSSGIAYCTAGTTTNGCVPAISGTGSASASAGSGFTISIADVEGQKSGLLFYGVTGAKEAPWGAGTSYLCIEAPLKRMSTQNSGGTAGTCDGVFSEDWNAYIAAHPAALGQPFVGGETVWAQGWFRDPPAPKSTNLSDALVFQLLP